jgi:hypothetical protein
VRLRRELYGLIRRVALPRTAVPRAAIAALTVGLASLLLTGCIGTAVDLVTLPVRVVGKTIDVLTTSQKEADRNRGRRERKAEEKAKKDAKKGAKKAERERQARR